jgi:hypothetical protein
LNRFAKQGCYENVTDSQFCRILRRSRLAKGADEMHFADGRRRPTKESPGTALWREPGIPHELFNRSGWRYRNILVELKIAGFGKA